MPLRSTATVLAASVLATSCVIVPVTVASYDAGCQVMTHHMELRATQVGAFQTCGNGTSDYRCAALLASLGVVAAASAVVSGSIVVVGDAVYWAEERTNCAVPVKPSPAAGTSG